MAQYYFEDLDAGQCELDDANGTAAQCPDLPLALNASPGENDAWIVFTPPGKLPICSIKPQHNDGGDGDSDDAPPCPFPFYLTEQNIYQSFANGGFASYNGVSCMRPAGGACPTVSPALAGVSFKQWDILRGPALAGDQPITSGTLCSLVGDYESNILSTLAGVAIDTGTAENNFYGGGSAVSIGVSVRGSDAGITYSCYFDTQVDDIVHSSPFSSDSASCSTLSGATFSSATGLFNWTPNVPGQWEFKIVASNGGQKGAQIFSVAVYPNVSGSSLYAYYDAQYADGGTGPRWGTAGAFDDLVGNTAVGVSGTPFFTGTGHGGTLHGFAGSSYAGWLGTQYPWQVGGFERTNHLRLDAATSTYTPEGTAIGSWDSRSSLLGFSQSTANAKPTITNFFRGSFDSNGLGLSFNGTSQFMWTHYENMGYRTYVIGVAFPENIASNGTIIKETDDANALRTES